MGQSVKSKLGVIIYDHFSDHYQKDNRTKMVTNERVVHLFPETWEQDIMRYFRDKYEVII